MSVIFLKSSVGMTVVVVHSLLMFNMYMQRLTLQLITEILKTDHLFLNL